MIAKLPPLITGCVVSALCAFSAFTGKTGSTAPTVPISGVLFSGGSSPESVGASLPRPITAETTSLPRLMVSLDPSARAVLPPGVDFAVHFVEPRLSTYTFTLTSLRKIAVKQPIVKPIIALPPAPPPVSEELIKPAAPPAKIEEEKPTGPATFSQFDEALRDSRTTQTVNLRIKNSGVTFRITHIGRIGDRGAVRYAITNQESADFFLSIINVAANGKAVRAETLGSYVCRAQAEIFGVVHFPATSVAGKRVSVELVQSGGDHRRIELPVEYAF